MKRKLKAKCGAVLLALSCILTNFSVSFADVTDEINCAEIAFGSQIEATNASVLTTFPAVTVGGREGIKSNAAGGDYYISIDLSDDFIYDVPEGTIVDVTIDYFDSGNGYFVIMYETDSDIFGSDYHNDINFDITERIDMTDTNEWKTYTFRIKDLKAANGLDGYDMRISMWSYVDGVNRLGEVVFGSAKIERLAMPDVTLSSAYTGNQFGKDEDIKFDLQYMNNVNEKAEVEYTYEVLDEDNEQLITGNGDIVLDAREKRIDGGSIVIPEKLKNGVYTINTNFKYKMESGRIFTDNLVENFSVSYVFVPGDGNDEIGACCYLMAGSGRVDPVYTALNASRAGLTIIRDQITAENTTYVDGNYVIIDAAIERMKKYKEVSGGELLILLSHPGNGYSGLPDNPERYKEYAKFCYDAVSQLRGITDYFEVWNEPNITFGNPTLAPPECYAEMSKAAYKRIKEANPNAFVMIGGTAASGSTENALDVEFHERIFAAGALDYADAVSVHPYDWSGNFSEKRLIRGLENLKELMTQYGGGDKEVWLTEYGFSSNPGGGGGQGYTELEQAQNYVLAYNIMKANDLVDKCTFYCLYDTFKELDVEHNWGWVAFDRYSADRSRTPNSAKKVFVAMTAASTFIGDDAESKKIINDVNAYAAHYYNSKLNKDVILLQTSAADKIVSLKLDTDRVDTYDMYGNKLETIYSDNGIYTLVADKSPVYIVGTFPVFELSEEKALVYCDSLTKDGAKGDSVYFNFTNNGDKELYITVDGAEVVKNDGFTNGAAAVKIRVPEEGESTSFYITVIDAEGRVYYSAKHKINIKPPIDVKLTSEPVVKDSADRWRIRAVVKNLANDAVVSGNIKITAPTAVAGANITRVFETLEPQQEMTFLFNIPKRINKSVVHAVAVAELADGFTASFENSTCFSSALYAYKEPTIDGVISAGEWNSDWIGAYSEEDYYKILSDWEGTEDLSFNGTMMWDEENFYFTAIVTDDIHFVNHTPNGISNTWRGDGLQIGLDDRETINPVEDSTFAEISIANVPGIGDIAYLQKTLYTDNRSERLIENAEIVIKRNGNYTIYECKLPWDEIFYENYVVRPDAPFRFSALVNDNDAAERKGFLQYTSGIGNRKSASEFGELKFYK